MITAQSLLVASQEIPIERVEGTGIRSSALLRVVAAALAVAAHPIDVIAAGGVRLAGQHAAIGKQPHAEHVGLHHPVVAINEHAVKPSGEGLGIEAGDQAVVG